MARWQIQNYQKKNAVERQLWHKDDQVLIKEEGYRWGIWECESDTKPDIDLDNPDGWESTDEWEFVEMIDGCWIDWVYPKNMTEEEQEQLMEIYDNDWYEGLENEGWYHHDTEIYLYGPLHLTNKDSGEEWHGED
jgi:hypothetical protein